MNAFRFVHFPETRQTSDGQLAARGPHAARSLIYSGPRQVSDLFKKIVNFTTVMT
jgi:hypothetical protein